MVPVIRGPVQAEWRLGELGLFLPLASAIRLIPQRTSVVPVHTHGTVTVIAVHWAARRVHRNQVMIGAEPVALGVAVGKQATL